VARYSAAMDDRHDGELTGASKPALGQCSRLSRVRSCSSRRRYGNCGRIFAYPPGLAKPVILFIETFMNSIAVTSHAGGGAAATSRR
jgi:hypothetical protein